MLETTWFLLWGVLWAIYFLLDGFDLGIGTLLPFVAKNETERRIVFNSMGPFWDGNEVWLITVGGVTFAAFPVMYATMFSALYTPLMLILFALILRGVTFEFRGQIDGPWWRTIWDVGMVVGSFVPAYLFGVAFANIFSGIPIDGEGVYQGSLFTLLNPYGLIGGVLFLFLFLVHGAIWLAVKTEGDIYERASTLAGRLWPLLLVIAVVFLIMTGSVTNLYGNYMNNPVLFLVPAIAVGAMILTRYFVYKHAWWKAWFSSALTIAGCTLFGVIGLYPTLLPSSIDPAFSITIEKAASTPLTLKIMLTVALIFIPIVIAYQAWVYHLFRHKVTEKDVVY